MNTTTKPNSVSDEVWACSEKIGDYKGHELYRVATTNWKGSALVTRSVYAVQDGVVTAWQANKKHVVMQLELDA
jgi:hypothetical protein